MKPIRKISILLLSISAIIGLIRGFRMGIYPKGNTVIFPYPDDMIKVSVFSTINVLGWIVFFLCGVFSVVVILCVLKGIRNYGYLIIVEGIFSSFFVLTHILLSGFLPVHLVVMPLCIANIVLGVLQTPREF